MRHKLVVELGATVWSMPWCPTERPAQPPIPSPYSYSMFGAHIVEFIEGYCGGFVDAAGCWCRPCEGLMRAASHRGGALVGSAIVTAAMVTPGDKQADIEQMRFFCTLSPEMAAGMVDGMLGMFPNDAFKQPESAPVLAGFRQDMLAWFASVRELGQYGNEEYQGGLCECIEANSPYWRHWASVKQPVLLTTGLDDAMCLRGMLDLAANMENATLVSLPGVTHFPQLECGPLYMEKVTDFIAARGFQRRLSPADAAAVASAAGPCASPTARGLKLKEERANSLRRMKSDRFGICKDSFESPALQVVAAEAGDA
jgi:hypothetical protein